MICLKMNLADSCTIECSRNTNAQDYKWVNFEDSGSAVYNLRNPSIWQSYSTFLSPFTKENRYSASNNHYYFSSLPYWGRKSFNHCSIFLQLILNSFETCAPQSFTVLSPQGVRGATVGPNPQLLLTRIASMLTGLIRSDRACTPTPYIRRATGST